MDPDVVVLVGDVDVLELWPWNDRAAASEIPPETTSAPATNHRLIRPSSAKPAFLEVTALLFMASSFGAGCKKTLNRL